MTNPFDSNKESSGNQQGGNNGQDSYGSFGSFGENPNNGNTYGSEHGGYGNNSYGGNSYDGSSYGTDQNNFGHNSYGASNYGGNSYGTGQGAYGQGYQQPGGYQQTGGYAGGYQQHNGLTVSPLDAMDAIGQAFKGFFKQPVPGALAGLAYYAIMFAIVFIPLLVVGVGTASTAATSYDPATETFSDEGAASLGALSILVIVVCYLIALFLAAWMYANFYSASRKVADGDTVSFGDFFKGDNVGGILGVYVCYILIVLVGSLLILPGIVAAILFWAAPAIKTDDPEKSVGDCFKESLQLVTKNFGQSLLFYIVFSLALGLFAMIPIVGILCVLPLRALGEILFVRAASKRPSMRWA